MIESDLFRNEERVPTETLVTSTRVTAQQVFLLQVRFRTSWQFRLVDCLKNLVKSVDISWFDNEHELCYDSNKRQYRGNREGQN